MSDDYRRLESKRLPKAGKVPSAQVRRAVTLFQELNAAPLGSEARYIAGDLLDGVLRRMTQQELATYYQTIRS